jgi:hypothetical protein
MSAESPEQAIVFVNDSRFPVTLRKRSYAGPVVCAVSPLDRAEYHTTSDEREIIFYPVYEAPLTASVTLKGQIDKSVFLQRALSDKAGELHIPPPQRFENDAVYIVFENKSGNGVSVHPRRNGNSFLTLFPDRADTINAGETGVIESDTRALGTPSIYHPSVDFPPVVYRAGCRYVFMFDGTQVTLLDERPLHDIGLPLPAAVLFSGTAPEAERDGLRAALEEGLAANNAPLRVQPDDFVDEGGMDMTSMNEAKTDVAKTDVDDTGVDEAGVDETGVDGTDVDKTDVGKTDIDETDEAAGANIRYIFSVEITASWQQRGFPLNRAVFSGQATVTLSRNGSIIVEQTMPPVTEFSEGGFYRAVRRFLSGDKRLYQAIAESAGF